MKGVLFLCVANSARSQLAEGLARALAPEGTRVFSAGSRPTGVRPEAIAVLAEIGIDISDHRAKSVGDVPAAEVDTVVTLCGEEECPLFLGEARRLHWGLPDPAAAAGSPEERLAAFRETRDELRRRIADLLGGPFAGRGLLIDGRTHLSPRDALPLLGAGAAVLVDLREGLERNGRAFDVAGVVAVPFRELEARLAELPRDRPLILADCVGLKSKEALLVLGARGFTAIASLNGGMVDWAREGFPTIYDRDEELAGGCACRLRPRRVYKPRGGC